MAFNNDAVAEARRDRAPVQLHMTGSPVVAATIGQVRHVEDVIGTGLSVLEVQRVSASAVLFNTVLLDLLYIFDINHIRGYRTMVITFAEALEQTQGQDRTLLLGNGFSAEYFNYRTLLEQSGLAVDDPLRSLFNELGTVDFEAAIKALEGAATVERAYGNNATSQNRINDANRLREALVHAVRETHPQHRNDLEPKYSSSSNFINNFNKIFTLNYDLLLYYSNLETGKLRDGFGLGEIYMNGKFIGPFKEEAYCEIYNLHGGLHLFTDNENNTLKALDTGDGVISTITDTVITKGRLPIYVAEGTTTQKMHKINSIPYLNHSYEQLKENKASVFVYGHSADENDSHIYRAIFKANIPTLYFGIYQATQEKIDEISAQLSKYKISSRSSTDIVLFESMSAHVWDADDV